MASFPAANAYTENGIDQGELRQRLTDQRDATVQLVGAGTVQSLTIAAGAITPASGASGSIVIDTEGAASSDTLTNISTANLPDGSHVLIRIADNGRVVDVDHAAGGAGQIALEGGLDHQLNRVGQWLELRREGTDLTEVRRGGREKEHIVGAAGEPAFAGSWGDGSAGTFVPKFWKDDSGIVLMSGYATIASVGAAASTIFTLPAGYRPAGSSGSYPGAFPSHTAIATVAELGLVSVDYTGLVRWVRYGSSPGAVAVVVDLSTVSFRAAQ